jgi:hypothetical protein
MTAAANEVGGARERPECHHLCGEIQAHPCHRSQWLERDGQQEKFTSSSQEKLACLAAFDYSPNQQRL